jgi:ParB-like chromosome segregation protein Spo0J
MRETRIIPIGLLVPPPEPMRLAFDEAELNELIDNIRAIGLLNALNVHPEVLPGKVERDAETGIESQPPPRPTGRYLIDAGHRRYTACRALGYTEIKCEVETDPGVDPESVMIAENMFRANLTAFEEANRFAEIAARPSMTEVKLQAIIKKPLSYIYARLDMLKGDPEISLAVHRGEINLAVARELNKVSVDFYRQKGREFSDAEWVAVEAAATEHRRYLLRLACDTGTTQKQAHSWVVQWEIEQGLRPPQMGPQVLPAPQPIMDPYKMQCKLCGQFDRPYDLEMVPICRNELRAILATLQQPESTGD